MLLGLSMYKMLSLKSFVCALTALVAASTALNNFDVDTRAAEDAHALEARQNNFATQYWANEFADLNWTSGAAGNYKVTWDQGFGGNFVVGKGYRPGGNMVVNYTGSFGLTGRTSRAYLALYGWTTSPLVEWYVIESTGAHHPADNANATCYGTFDSDGGTYELWMKWRINSPSIIGDADFQQFWSIRTKRHVGGTINTTRHFEAFDRAGLKLGRHSYMAMAIEGQIGSGAADITVGVKPTTTVPESTTYSTRTEVPIRTNTCTGRL
jgi:endo-1,4-beta-xylanase